MGQFVDGNWVDEFEMSMMKTLPSSQRGWTSDSGKRYKASRYVQQKLSPGIYRILETDHGIFFELQEFPTDIPARLAGLPCDYILNQIKLFWTKADVYKQYKLIHKRGVLLYGKPGCGKTSIIRLLADEVISLGGIVFSIDDFELAARAMAEFRSVERDRSIMTIQEDIEGLFSGSEGADQVKSALSFLDGQDQVNNIVHVATTNKPEEIEDRFIKRPGRFDLVIGLRTPTAVTREAYLQYVCKNTIPGPELKELVEKTKGLPLSYLREIASTYLCLGIPLSETLERLNNLNKTRVIKNDNSTEEVGFVIGYNGPEGRK